MPHRGFALHADVIVVVLDIEQRLRGVLHPPHHDDGDFDGIAVLVVDLELIAGEVARA